MAQLGLSLMVSRIPVLAMCFLIMFDIGVHLNGKHRHFAQQVFVCCVYHRADLQARLALA